MLGRDAALLAGCMRTASMCNQARWGNIQGLTSTSNSARAALRVSLVVLAIAAKLWRGQDVRLLLDTLHSLQILKPASIEMADLTVLRRVTGLAGSRIPDAEAAPRLCHALLCQG